MRHAILNITSYPFIACRELYKKYICKETNNHTIFAFCFYDQSTSSIHKLKHSKYPHIITYEKSQLKILMCKRNGSRKDEQKLEI